MGDQVRVELNARGKLVVGSGVKKIYDNSMASEKRCDAPIDDNLHKY